MTKHHELTHPDVVGSPGRDRGRILRSFFFRMRRRRHDMLLLLLVLLSAAYGENKKVQRV